MEIPIQGRAPGTTVDVGPRDYAAAQVCESQYHQESGNPERAFENHKVLHRSEFDGHGSAHYAPGAAGRQAKWCKTSLFEA
jgi:hypothetical protein